MAEIYPFFCDSPYKYRLNLRSAFEAGVLDLYELPERVNQLLGKKSMCPQLSNGDIFRILAVKVGSDSAIYLDDMREFLCEHPMPYLVPQLLARKKSELSFDLLTPEVITAFFDQIAAYGSKRFAFDLLQQLNCGPLVTVASLTQSALAFGTVGADAKSKNAASRNIWHKYDYTTGGVSSSVMRPYHDGPEASLIAPPADVKKVLGTQGSELGRYCCLKGLNCRALSCYDKFLDQCALPSQEQFAYKPVTPVMPSNKRKVNSITTDAARALSVAQCLAQEVPALKQIYPALRLLKVDYADFILELSQPLAAQGINLFTALPTTHPKYKEAVAQVQQGALSLRSHAFSCHWFKPNKNDRGCMVLQREAVWLPSVMPHEGGPEVRLLLVHHQDQDTLSKVLERDSYSVLATTDPKVTARRLLQSYYLDYLMAYDKRPLVPWSVLPAEVMTQGSAQVEAYLNFSWLASLLSQLSHKLCGHWLRQHQRDPNFVENPCFMITLYEDGVAPYFGDDLPRYRPVKDYNHRVATLPPAIAKYFDLRTYAKNHQRLWQFVDSSWLFKTAGFY